MKVFAALSYPLSLLLGPLPGLVLLIAAKERWAQRHAVKALMLFVAELGVALVAMILLFAASAVAVQIQGAAPAGETSELAKWMAQAVGLVASTAWISLLAWSLVLARRAWSGDEASGDWIDGALPGA